MTGDPIPGTHLKQPGTLRWRLGALSDLSGCWLEWADLRDPLPGKQRTTITVERANRWREDGQYQLLFEVLTYEGELVLEVWGPNCATPEEAMLLAEDLLVGILAQQLTEWGVPPERVIP